MINPCTEICQIQFDNTFSISSKGFSHRYGFRVQTSYRRATAFQLAASRSPMRGFSCSQPPSAAAKYVDGDTSDEPVGSSDFASGYRHGNTQYGRGWASAMDISRAFGDGGCGAQSSSCRSLSRAGHDREKAARCKARYLYPRDVGR